MKNAEFFGSQNCDQSRPFKPVALQLISAFVRVISYIFGILIIFALRRCVRNFQISTKSKWFVPSTKAVWFVMWRGCKVCVSVIAKAGNGEPSLTSRYKQRRECSARFLLLISVSLLFISNSVPDGVMIIPGLSSQCSSKALRLVCTWGIRPDHHPEDNDRTF